MRIAATILDRLYRREQIGESRRLWRETRRGLSRWSEAGRSRLLVTILSTWWVVTSHGLSLISHLSEENEKEDEGKFDNSKQLSRGS